MPTAAATTAASDLLPMFSTTHFRRAATLRSVLLGSSALLLLSAMTPFAGSAPAAVTCAQVATPAGPTVQTAIERLAPGQTACVRGEVVGNVAIRRPDLSLTSEPGQRGRVVGQVKVMPEGHRATVQDLDIDGHTEPEKPTVGIYADDVAFRGNDVTNRDTEICFIVGYGDIVAARARIEANRIHNCGERPESNMDHGIYLESTVDSWIVGNDIYDNADRGIQVYPWARRTTITGNVIDGNGVGVIFGGLNGTSATDNVVRYNVITNSRVRNDVESWYPEGTPAGTGNVVERNCVDPRSVSTARGGFTARDNVSVTSDPGFADRAAKDFRLSSGSPCSALLQAGRAGMDWVPPAELVPQPAPVKPAAPVKPVRLDVTQAPGGKVDLRVQLSDPAAAPARTLVQVQFGKRAWRTVGTPKLSRKRVYRKRVKAPKRSRRVRVRAIVLDERRTVSRAVRRKRAAKKRTLSRRAVTASKRLV